MEKLVTVLYEWGTTRGKLFIMLYIAGTLSSLVVALSGLFGISSAENIFTGALLLTCLPLLWFFESAAWKIYQKTQEKNSSIIGAIKSAPKQNFLWVTVVAIVAPTVLYWSGVRDPTIFILMGFFGLYAFLDTFLEILVSLNQNISDVVSEKLPENYTRSDVFIAVENIRSEND